MIAALGVTPWSFLRSVRPLEELQIGSLASLLIYLGARSLIACTSTETYSSYVTEVAQSNNTPPRSATRT